MKKLQLCAFFMLLCLVFISCGAEKKADAPPVSAESMTAPAGEGPGVLLAKEILDTFDEMVAKAVMLSAEKPAPVEIRPKLEEMYEAYRGKMAEFNGRYLALRDSDMAQFGACNGYLGVHRGKHVFKKDNDMAQMVSHYNFQLGDQDMVKLLSTVPVEILDIAVNPQQDPQ